ncbi:MAG: threonylcarbamoyl-AMP synthase [Proteobacteria bacterium]|jgi:L-threonylcarbamoyladenylate synthase|nr:threonylcarbamoyl-AMP synthase [Pseudomonadota bacterium]
MQKQNSTPNFDSAIDFLDQGKIVIYPTETLYGMGVDAQNPKAIEYLFQIKKRALNKPLPILIPSRKDIDQYCKEISPVARTLMQAFWPGPLTIILKCDLFPKGISHNGTVGFKVSGHPLVQNLLLQYKRPITTTSANVSNKESPQDPLEFFRIFPKDSFVLIQEIKPSKPAPSSTVVDCSGESWKIVREGEITPEDIQDALSEAGL